MANETHASNRESESFDLGFSSTLGSLIRLVSLLTGIAVIGVGMYCGWHVFKQVESIVTEGKPLETAVDRVADVIEAKNITIIDADKGVNMQLGRSVAVSLLWMFYGVWALVAMGFIKAGGSLIATSVSAASSKKK